MPRSVDDIISDNEGLVTEDDAESIRQDEMREERSVREDELDRADEMREIEEETGVTLWEIEHEIEAGK
jgi:hypothetical protein